MSAIDLLKIVSLMSLVTLIGVGLIVRFSAIRSHPEKPDDV